MLMHLFLFNFLSLFLCIWSLHRQIYPFSNIFVIPFIIKLVCFKSFCTWFNINDCWKALYMISLSKLFDHRAVNSNECNLVIVLNLIVVVKFVPVRLELHAEMTSLHIKVQNQVVIKIFTIRLDNKISELFVVFYWDALGITPPSFWTHNNFDHHHYCQESYLRHVWLLLRLFHI